MTDGTVRIESAQNEQAKSPREILRDAQNEFQNMLSLLREHQLMLRQRGMNLPTPLLENMRNIYAELEESSEGHSQQAVLLRQLRGLAETTNLLNGSIDLDQLLSRVIDKVIEITGAERGFVMLRADNGSLEYHVARGLDREALAEEDFTISMTIVNSVAETGQPVLTDNAHSDPRYDEHQSVHGFALRSILCVPLRVNEVIIGVIYCDNRMLSGLFNTQEQRMLSAFADQAAVAIQNAQLFAAANARIVEVLAMREFTDRIFGSVASGLIAIDEEGNITAFNTAAAQITHVDASLALLQPFAHILPELYQMILPALEQMFQGDKQAPFEADLILPNGEARIWKIALSPLRDPEQADVLIGATIVLDDLTEQRDREMRMHHVQRYIPIALIENLQNVENISSLGGEEREISVYFSDIRSFTKFSENLQPELLMEILNQYLTAASYAINQYEGLVDKYIGDAVTGLFNTSLNPQADHALRAVQAAINVRTHLNELHLLMPEDQRLFFGIGVHTGMAVLGNVGSEERREFMAMGDAVDTAKFMQENALSGEILLSEATYERVKEHFVCEAIPVRKPQKYAQITTIYRLVSPTYER